VNVDAIEQWPRQTIHIPLNLPLRTPAPSHCVVATTTRTLLRGLFATGS
jgi:hypothetical protein